MPKEYEVFEPNDEHIARIITRILGEKGYSSSYQIGYPRNKIFIIVKTKEEADGISGKIREFMEKIRVNESGNTADEGLDNSRALGKLERLIPKISEET